MSRHAFKGPKQHRPELAKESGSIIHRDEALKRELGFDSESSQSDAEAEEPSDEEEEVESNDEAIRRGHTKGDRGRQENLVAVKIAQSDLRLCRLELNKLKQSKSRQLKLIQKTHADSLAEMQKLVEELKDLLEEKDESIRNLEARLRGDESASKGTSRGGASVKNLVEQVSKLHKDKTALSERAALDRNRIEDMEAKAGILKEEMKQLKEEMKELGLGHENRPEPEQEVKVNGVPDKIMEEIQEKERELTDLRTANQKLMVQLKQAEDKVGKEKASVEAKVSKKMDDDIKRLEAKLAQAQAETKTRDDAYQQNKGELIRKLSDFRKEKEKINKEKEEIQERREKIQKSLHDSEMKRKNLEQMNETAKEKMKNLETEIVRYKALNDQQGKEQSDVVKTNSQLKVQVNGLTAKVVELETALGGLQNLSTEQETDLETLQEERRKVKMDLSSTSAQLQSSKEQVESLKNQLHRMEQDVSSKLTQAAKEKENALDQLRRECDNTSRDLKRRLRFLSTHVSDVGKGMNFVRVEYENLKAAHRILHSSVRTEFSQIKTKISKAISKIDETNKTLVVKYKNEMALRKKLHNEVIELKGNIRVFCRVRPTIREDGQGAQAAHVVSFDYDDDQLVNVFVRGATRSFEMDNVFRPMATQDEIFSDVKTLITSCMDGYNVCIFAYGQTGSGKTYTMEGPEENPGVNPRALDELFAVAKERALDWTYEITMSVLEIYNEQIRDLLGENPSAKMEIRQHPEGHLYVPGLCWVQVAARVDVQEVFSLGRENRATACTNMNEHSSRSHALLCVKVKGTNKTTGARCIGRLNLIDLAGSERVAKSGTEGERLKEAQNINKSLSSLGDVIHSLKNKSSHIPFRNSKLTYLLQDSLSGNSKTLMIVHAAPVEKNVGETVNSLTFASRVRAVELGQATRKTQSAEIAELRERLRQYEDPTAVSQVTGLPKRAAARKKLSSRLPVYSGKHTVRGEFRIFSSNR
ncbi:kinesin-like protein KIFC3 isoform X3 [Oscarella lobularis]